MKLLLTTVGIVLLLQAQQTIQINVDLRELVISVRDPQGRFVTGLQAADLTVEEDGVPQSIVHFAPEDSQTPVSVGILIDNRRKYPVDNNTDEGRRRILGDHPAFYSAIAGAKELIDHMRTGDEIGLMTFSDSLKVDQDFTANTEVLQARLQQLKIKQRLNGPPTELTTLSAIVRALDKMSSAKQRKRVLIVFSEWNNEYADKEAKDLNKLKGQIGPGGSVIYGFGIEGEGVSTPGVQGRKVGDSFLGEILTTLASGSGGLSKIFGVITPDEQTARSTEFIRTVESNLHGQYRIGYYSRNPDVKAKHTTSVRTISPGYQTYSTDRIVKE